MLTKDELVSILHDIESDRVERTTSIKDTDKFCQAVCAFANDLPNHRKPGYLIIGANDDGSLSGLKVTDQLLQNLGGIRSDGNILPLPAMTVQKRDDVPGGELALVAVLPSDIPPVRYKGQVWIRVGPRRAIASESEERILWERRTAFSATFDATPCFECRFEDLVPDLFSITYLPNAVAPEIIKENRRDVREQMSSLSFYDLQRNCATFAGALLFAKYARHWLPGAYVQFVRFDGVNITDEPIDEHQFAGDLLTVLRELDAFLPGQIRSRPVPVSVLRDEQIYDYPLFALREFLMNAIMHRSYQSNAPVRFYWFDDRVEIQNPGGLYGEATPENFPKQNAYRNPVVASAMKVLGYVHTFASGVLKAQEAIERNGNQPPEFTTDEPHFFLVKVPRLL
ncbi:MAG TPA: ATP-binding protein [bacterium]|nr:ATP-binding protein [bacterium]